jgi:predicted nucleic acid-binding protein
MPQLVRSLYLDTNIFVSAAQSVVHSEASQELIDLVRARRVAVVGSALLRREIGSVQRRLPTHLPFQFYLELAVLELPQTREVIRLGARYGAALGIKGADAEHLAYATIAGADVFLSWNRRDLVRSATIHGVHVVNAALGLPTPTITDPSEFLKRVRPSRRYARVLLD